MNHRAQGMAAGTIKRELTAAIYDYGNVRARHLLHLLTAADPYSYIQLVQTLLSAPRVDELIKLLNRIAVYLESSETLTGWPMSPASQSPKILALSRPWLEVGLWYDNRQYDVAVFIKGFVLRDVMLYLGMPDCPCDIKDLAFRRHEPIYDEIVKRYLLKPEVLMIYFWAPGAEKAFYRIHFIADEGHIRYEARVEVEREEVEAAIGAKLSDSPFKE